MFSHAGGQQYCCIEIRVVANTTSGITIASSDLVVKRCDLYQPPHFLLGTIARPKSREARGS